MSDKDQRTEDATPKRLEQLRKDGKVSSSSELTSISAVLGAGTALFFTATHAARSINAFARRAFRFADVHQPAQATGAILSILLDVVLPVLLVAMSFAIIVGGLQTRALVSFKSLKPDFGKMNPTKKFKQIFPSVDSAQEIGKSFLKILLIGVVVYNVVVDALPRFFTLSGASMENAVFTIQDVALKVSVRGALALLIMGVVDYLLTKRKFTQDAKMSLQDIKDERKQSEADPAVRQKLKARAREFAKQRAVADVRGATVIVANPTHFSVALRYDASIDAAPIVLAKGVDEVALAMRTEARKFSIPVVENPPLARALHASVRVGSLVPEQFYRAVATVIAHVMGLRSDRMVA